MRKLGIGWLMVVVGFLYLPISVMMLMAFNASPLYTLPIELTGHWFVDLTQNERLLDAGRNSLLIAAAVAIIATFCGTLAALALGRRSFRGKRVFQMLLLPPIAIPWLIIGTAMLVFFYWTGIGRGLHAMILGHVALVAPLCGARRRHRHSDAPPGSRRGGDEPWLDAAARVLRRDAAAALMPSIIAAALFAFAVSLDQFVISYFLAKPGVTTLPVEIYSSIRKGFTPEINAISTLLLGRLDGSRPRFRLAVRSRGARMSAVDVAGVTKTYGPVDRPRSGQHRFRGRPVHQPARSVGVGQDHAAAHHRRLRHARTSARCTSGART